MTTIIYHRSDPDGWFSNTVARKFLPEDTQSIGWEYNDPVPEIPPEGDIYMVDISVAALLDDPALRSRIVWIDHHKTAIEKWDVAPHNHGDQDAPPPFRGVRIDGVAACRLCWWFFQMQSIDPAETLRSPHPSFLPERIDWSRRQSGEPEVLFLVGLRDVWKHEGTRDEWACNTLNLSLVARQDDEELRQHLIDQEDEDSAAPGVTVGSLCDQGSAIQRYAYSLNAEHAVRGGMIRRWRGLTWAVLNSQAKGNQTLAAWAQLRSEVIDGLLVWSVGAGGKVNVSLYHAPGQKDHDLSLIAKAMGGGGHPGACGFQADLDWALDLVRAMPLAAQPPMP